MISRYGRRFGEQLLVVADGDGGNVVGSPVGAWLLVALCAPLCDGVSRARVEEHLGIDAEAAAALARRLLDHPHPAVATALALWHRRGSTSSSFPRWEATMPRMASLGAIPTRAAADEWARASTLGAIEQFPGPIDNANVSVVLANALASRVNWCRPYHAAPSAMLRSPWSRRVDQVLMVSEPHEATCFFAQTTTAGLVAAHVALSVEGLRVCSVIADPSRPAAAVQAAALQVAQLATNEPTEAVRAPLADLPLGDQPGWSVHETACSPGEQDEVTNVVLPTWTASNSLDLASADLGFHEIASGFVSLFADHTIAPVAAQQVAFASYRRTGFEAAALGTAMTLGASEWNTRARRREATLRFGHPYAVVATTSQPQSARGRRADRFDPDAWLGLPVYCAWITDPDEPDAT